jgi:hypothetical protein
MKLFLRRSVRGLRPFLNGGNVGRAVAPGVHAARTASGRKIRGAPNFFDGFSEESADRLAGVARGVHAGRNGTEWVQARPLRACAAPKSTRRVLPKGAERTIETTDYADFADQYAAPDSLRP